MASLIDIGQNAVHGWVTPAEEAQYVHAVNRCYELSQSTRSDSTKIPEYQRLDAIRNAIGLKVQSAKKRPANPATYDPFVQRMQAKTYNEIVPYPTAEEITRLRYENMYGPSHENMYGHSPSYSPEFLQNAAEIWEHNKRKWLQEKEAYEASQTAQQTSHMPRYGYGFK